jgi:flagellar hook-associated protein 1 FlgK
MSSTFFGLNIARSGLFASQRALHVTGHNISNVNTPGFSRQRLNVTQSNPMALPGGQGMIGSGVDTHSITQLRDEFLDFKIRQEMTTGGEWDVRAEMLQQVEAIFNEPSESGIRRVLDDFFNSVQQLSKGENADNLTARAELRQRGIALTKTINHMYSQLQDMQSNTDFAIRTTVDQINGYAEQIARLNKQIFLSETDGSHANDLRDQRNLLIDQLSELVDIEVQEIPIVGSKDGTMTLRISINGEPLVDHLDHNQLMLAPRNEIEKKNYVDNMNLVDVHWVNKQTGEPGSKIRCQSGKLEALLDMRDNMDGTMKGIPYYMDRLNRFTTVFAARFNMQHGQGYGLSGAGNHHPFFDWPEMDYKVTEINDPTVLPGDTDAEKIANYEEDNPGETIFKINGDWYKAENAFGYKKVDSESLKGDTDSEKIANYEKANSGSTIFKMGDNWYTVKIVRGNQIDISYDIKDSLNNIAAASNYIENEYGNKDGLPGDGSNALALSELRHDVKMFAWGGPDDYFKSLISNLGVDTQEAIRMTDNQKVLINQIESGRQAISGVSLDEEMSNMIRFQHSYNASARMITTIDEMLDKIINGMGVVGR